MKKMNWKNCLTIGTLAALALSLLVGCGDSLSSGTQQSASESGAAGTVLLSVNPEIKVEYDNGGLVLEIDGNDDWDDRDGWDDWEEFDDQDDAGDRDDADDQDDTDDQDDADDRDDDDQDDADDRDDNDDQDDAND